MSELRMNWPPPPAELLLGPQDVHVWSTNLNPVSEQIVRLKEILSTDEQARAARFRFERDQNRFITGRGFLRTVLGRYLNQNPAEIKFNYTTRGKPTLDVLPGAELHFNLSHSQDFALLAITKICPVGVDVEQIRTLRDADAIADRFFSERESSMLRALPPEQKPIGFFNLWTRKEAWLKATGEGISESLDKVEVSLLPDEPAKLLSLFGNSNAVTEWTLADLNPASGYKGALALPSTNVEMKFWAHSNG
jgi:4'-phosphopantetheinyl transferase